jgi:hypothetical protein
MEILSLRPVASSSTTGGEESKGLLSAFSCFYRINWIRRDVLLVLDLFVSVPYWWYIGRNILHRKYMSLKCYRRRYISPANQPGPLRKDWLCVFDTFRRPLLISFDVREQQLPLQQPLKAYPRTVLTLNRQSTAVWPFDKRTIPGPLKGIVFLCIPRILSLRQMWVLSNTLGSVVVFQSSISVFLRSLFPPWVLSCHGGLANEQRFA